VKALRPLILGAAGVLIVAAGACGDQEPATAPAAPAATSSTTTIPETTTPETTTPRPAGTSKGGDAVESDLSQLKALGIDVEVGVILDVADDGVDRFLQVGRNGVVDFTGTTRTDSTMMSLKPAPVAAKNRVTIKPPFWNEDTGAGSCVADTAGAALKLETCRTGRSAQIWQVVPAGDSGQFELRGAHGVLHVEDGRLITADSGRTGLQTLDFAG
jgi:hypothetical protein